MFKTLIVSILFFTSFQVLSSGLPNLDRMVVAYDDSFNEMYLGVGDSINNKAIQFIEVGEEVQLEAYKDVNFAGHKIIVQHNDWKFDPTDYLSFNVTDIPAFDDESSVYLNLDSKSQRCLEVVYFSQQLNIPRTHLTNICSEDKPQLLVNLNDLISENHTIPVTINFAINDANFPYGGNAFVTGIEVELSKNKAKIKDESFFQPSGYRVIKDYINTITINTW